MVIYDLNILRTLFRPYKAHAEPIVYPDAVLPGSPALWGFQSVARWNLQVFELPRAIEHGQFAHSHGLNVHETPDTLTFEQTLRMRTLERGDWHTPLISRSVSIVNR
jgi:hypothetical protein